MNFETDLDRAAIAHSGEDAREQAGHSPLRTPRQHPTLIFINRFFFPDHSATSQILTDLAFHLAATGHSVRVITSRQLYDDPNADPPEEELVDRVAIHRLSTTRFGRAALLGRGFDYLSFYVSAFRMALRLAKPGDILIAETDPPLLSVPARLAASRRDLRLVNWLQDLYPEAAIELGMPIVSGILGRALVRLRDATLRAATANVAIGELMGERLRQRGVAAERIHIIPNWCDDEEVRPVAHINNPLRREWGLGDSFVIGYSGNLGRAHEFETVLDAAVRLRDEPKLLFLLIGGGACFAELQGRVNAAGLAPMFRFVPYQERALLKYSLGAADVHWLSLRPALEGLIVPSKFYGIAAAGRLTIAITSPDGEVARLVRRYGCGAVVPPGDGAKLAEVLRGLANDPAAVAEMGKRGRQMLDAYFTRKAAFAAWEQLVERIATAPPSDN